MPTKGPYKLKRSHQQLVDSTVTIDDGSFVLGENQADGIFADISFQLFSTRATGMSLSSLIGSSSSSSAASASSAPSAPQLRTDGDGMMVFGFGPTPSPQQVEGKKGRGPECTKTRGGRRPAANAAKHHRHGSPAEPSPVKREAPGADGGSVVKGRPKRDLPKTLEITILEFETATEESCLYFGEKWKTQRRWLERPINDLNVAVPLTQTCPIYIWRFGWWRFEVPEKTVNPSLLTPCHLEYLLLPQRSSQGLVESVCVNVIPNVFFFSTGAEGEGWVRQLCGV